MNTLDEIINNIHPALESRTAIREQALSQTRTLTRKCANVIRAVHRGEDGIARDQLIEASKLVRGLRADLVDYQDIYYAGYTQDALKEFAEASITYALINDQRFPTPEDIGVENVTYLQGLAETTGELRRRCLDILREGHSSEAERLLQKMDDIYSVLLTIDYPDAVTRGLRRLTDFVRGVTERTRGDVTMSIRQQKLERGLRNLEDKLKQEE